MKIKIATVWPSLKLGLLMATGVTTFITHNSGAAPSTSATHGIISSVASPYGHTYGEWGALWWRWALGIPFPENPVFNDPTGALGANGQAGPVWFLAGSGFNDPAIPITRTLEVPAGKALFFPVVNSVWITTCQGDPRTLDGIRPLVAPDIDAVAQNSAEVDGVPVQGLASFRAESPLFCAPLAIFGIYNPEDLVGMGFCVPDVPEQYNADCLDLPYPDEHFGPADGFGPAMTDGIWLMLPPLSKGQHTIKFSATREDGLGLDVTYSITVN